jgi:hypothetical protein
MATGIITFISEDRTTATVIDEKQNQYNYKGTALGPNKNVYDGVSFDIVNTNEATNIKVITQTNVDSGTPTKGELAAMFALVNQVNLRMGGKDGGVKVIIRTREI